MTEPEMTSSYRASYERLRDAILAFVATHPHKGVKPFQDAVAGWGGEWKQAAANDLPATRFLAPALSMTHPDTREMVALFEAEKANLKWEQSYTRADGVVGEDMLSGYGFAEVIGKHGPFVSTKVRTGIGVWGPDIDYPLHRHEAEEVYIVLAGSARFQLGESESASIEMRHAGDVVHVPSMLTHGFSTMEEPLVVFYIWQAGDLRQKSSFS